MSNSDMNRDSPAGEASSGETDQISFAAAMLELDEIVSALESDRLDVDVLADRVERAAFLVGTCRDRLDATRLRVEEIIVRLDGRTSTQTPAPAAATDPTTTEGSDEPSRPTPG